MSAVDALGRIDKNWARSDGARRCVFVLIKRLGSKEGEARSSAAETLGHLGQEAGPAVATLIECLADPNSGVRGSAAEALEKIDKGWAKSASASLAVPELVARLTNGDEKVKQSAAEILFVKMGSSAVPELVKLLDSKDLESRRIAVWGLGRIGPDASKAIEDLINCLTDSDTDVPAVVNALGKIDKEWGKTKAARRAMFILADLLSHRDREVRRGMAEALGMMGSDATRVIPDLVIRLDDVSLSVREAVESALDRIDKHWRTRRKRAS